MGKANLEISTEGSGSFTQYDGNDQVLYTVSATEPRAIIDNINGTNQVKFMHLNVVLRSSNLAETELNGILLDQDPKVAAGQLAAAGFKTPSGGSGGVESFNGKTGIVEYPVWKKTDGVTNADSYSEEIKHNQFISSVLNNNSVASRLLKIEVGEFGFTGAHGQLELYKYARPLNGFNLGASIFGYGVNDGTPSISIVGSAIGGGATTNPVFGVHNFIDDLFFINADGQVVLSKYGNGTFTGVATKLLGSDVNGGIIELDYNPNNFEQSEGQVKINTGKGVKPTATGFAPDVANILAYESPLGLSSAPTTQFPLSQTGLDSDIIDFTTGNFLEVPIDGLVNTWRINYTFSNKAANSNAGLTIGLFNPSTTFETSVSFTLPSNTTDSPNIDLGGGDIRQVEQSVLLTTIADSSSIGSGYKLFTSLTSSDNNFTVVIESVTRVTGVKEVRI